MIVQRGGDFPNTLSDIRKVPGIGDYTAGAIASIAFGQVTPTLSSLPYLTMSSSSFTHHNILSRQFLWWMETLSVLFPD